MGTGWWILVKTDQSMLLKNIILVGLGGMIGSVAVPCIAGDQAR
jgi:hypothetical protein